MVGMADGLEAHGEGGVVVRENGGKEDDPFDLIPIIESVMREQKGRKRSIWEVEYAKPMEYFEPTASRQKKVFFF
ncbi:hypothetical protein ACFX1S_019080 [Malus domestica]